MFKRAFSVAPALIIALICTSCLMGFAPKSVCLQTGLQDSSFEEQILREINQYRQLKNLPALQMNEAISVEARKHSLEMASGKSAFGHDGFDSRVTTINKQLAGSKKFAENVAYGHLSAKEVVGIWLNSAGHRRNIEGAFNLTGIGTSAKNDGTIFFTQLFVAR